MLTNMKIRITERIETLKIFQLKIPFINGMVLYDNYKNC